MERIQLSESVYAEKIGRVFKIVIDRADAGNAVDGSVSSGVDAGITKALEDTEVGAIILTGAGEKFFCSGMDLKFFAKNGAASLRLPDKGFCGLTEREISKPIICAVNGFALGGGCEVALSCDLIIASEHAQFGLPEIKRGIFAGGGGPIRIGKSIPRVLANEMLLTGDFISAQKACDIHLINKVVPKEKLMEEAMSLAERVAANCPLGLAATKQLINNAFCMDMKEAFELSNGLAKKVYYSEDAKEGPKAFAEKRLPVWQGK